MELLTAYMLTLYMGTMGVIAVSILANKLTKTGTDSGRGKGKVVQTGIPYTGRIGRKAYAS